MAGRRGALIVLEGVDRAGKSTQSRKLVEALRAAGHCAELLRFPERSTEIGKLLSSYLEKKREVEDHSVHLLFSANRWEQVPLIKEKLGQGVTLVVDRYAFSGVAFTSAKENFHLDWCKQPDVGLPKPDLVVFLQLQLAVAAARGEFGRERYENRAFQERVLQRFHQLMRDPALNWKVAVSTPPRSMCRQGAVRSAGCRGRQAGFLSARPGGPMSRDSSSGSQRPSFRGQETGLRRDKAM
ncbi:thymidylate kinase isoform X1 [Pteropus vampyrus]|uniref:Thymidylate kinase n=1 Tax=Pteropus vampyrus TaxID=132908 RepID=A0A6P3RIL7_PTEVA|nr:thymidylate kinase isoform X1 [Pteropus vampyrus]